MAAHVRVGDAEPEPGAFAALGGVERLEHMRQNVRGNAAAGVGDAISTASLNFTFLRRDGNGSASGARLRRVQQQVHQDLRELIGVGAESRIGRPESFSPT